MEEQLSTSAEERDSHPPCPSTPPAVSCPNACWRREHSKNEHRTRLFHEETGGLFSSATYSWIFPLLSLGKYLRCVPNLIHWFVSGNKRPLEMDDLPELHWTTSAADVFESHLKRHLAHRLGGTEHSEIPSEPPIEDIEVSGDDRPLLSSRRWRRGNADKEPARRLNLWLVITQFVAVDMVDSHSHSSAPPLRAHQPQKKDSARTLSPRFRVIAVYSSSVLGRNHHSNRRCPGSRQGAARNTRN